MNIRRAENKDMKGINKLLHQVLMVHHNGRPDIFKPNAKKYTDAELMDILADDTKPVFVATDEQEEVLGYAFCVFQQHLNNNILTDIKTIYIDDLCVDVDKRGMHIGTARLTASQVFHTPYDEVTPLQRSNAKAVNFGIVYGISSFGLGQDLNISRKEAEEYINRYFETYPKIKQYLDSLVDEAKTKGYVTTLFGRRRPVPEIASSNFMQRSFGERIAMNSPVQGTAADIMKIAMIRVDERLKKDGSNAKIVLQVHDELLIETPENEIDYVKKILQEEMEAAADISVPLEVSVSTGTDWYETK